MQQRFVPFLIIKVTCKILVACLTWLRLSILCQLLLMRSTMLKIVAEKAMLRRLISKLTESVNQAYEASQPADEIIAQAEKGLIDVSENANRSGFKNIRDV